MYWIILFFAGLLEIVWAIGMKYSQGFTKIGPSILTIGVMAISLGMLAFSAKHLPIGTAYAVWTGIGAAGTAIAGMLLFQESKDFSRIICIFLIILGIAGLKYLEK